jgi:hypothetical protein
MIRPSTHPAEAYRRSESALVDQLASTLRTLRHLDPVDFHVKAGDLIDTLEEAISTLEHLLASTPLPDRWRMANGAPVWGGALHDPA